MAARENQGYLIAVIILVLLSLVLALVAFLGVQKAYEQADAAESLENKLTVSRLIADAEALKGEALKSIIGDLGVSASELPKTRNDIQQLSTNSALTEADRNILDNILKEVTAAQEIYKSETNGSIRDVGDGEVSVATLRTRIEELTTLVDKQRTDNKTQVDLAKEAERDAAAKITVAQEAKTLAEKARDDAIENLEAEKQASLEKQQRLTKEVEAGSKAITDLTAKSNEAAQAAKVVEQQLENEVASLEVANVDLKTRLNKLTNEVFDHADGQVIRVAPELDTVFIDIGRADGLTNNRTFSVYDQAVTNFETATAKASIEVVRVDTFRAEARITSENPVDPILKFDHILTPTWDPGFALKIALGGRFDLDGDRYDDTEKLIRLIERNGGQVVVKHDEKGKVTGKISPEVRYLVRGNEPLVGNDDDDLDAGKILEALRTMEADAEQNTVQIIDLQKLLNRLGVSAQPKTKQLDFPPGGFKPRPARPTRDSGSSSRSSGLPTR